MRTVPHFFTETTTSFNSKGYASNLYMEEIFLYRREFMIITNSASKANKSINV